MATRTGKWPLRRVSSSAVSPNTFCREVSFASGSLDIWPTRIARPDLPSRANFFPSRQNPPSHQHQSPPTSPPTDVLTAMEKCGWAQICPPVNWLPSADLWTARRACHTPRPNHVPLGAGALVSLWDARFPSTSFSLSPDYPFLSAPAPLDALQAAFPASFGVCLPARRESKPKKNARGSIARPAPPAASFKSPLSKLPRPAHPDHSWALPSEAVPIGRLRLQANNTVCARIPAQCPSVIQA